MILCMCVLNEHMTDNRVADWAWVWWALLDHIQPSFKQHQRERRRAKSSVKGGSWVSGGCCAGTIWWGRPLSAQSHCSRTLDIKYQRQNVVSASRINDWMNEWVSECMDIPIITNTWCSVHSVVVLGLGQTSPNIVCNWRKLVQHQRRQQLEL